MFRAMSVRRLVSVLSVVLVASATVVVAQPKKNDPKTPVAPAKDATPAAGSAAPAGSGSAEGSAVEMVEDPPADMEGINEDPDAPKTGSGSDASVVAVPEKKKTSGYPSEEALRPITLPANMSEISLGFSLPVDPFVATAALRARYGITRQVQLGLTYVVAGVYDDPGTTGTSKRAIHPGKAVGLDVTILLQDWIGLRIGVPVYIDPVAVGITLGAPMKFRFADGKLAFGGLDDFINIALPFGAEFAPSLTQESTNALFAFYDTNGTPPSRGSLRFSGFAVYQKDPKLAFIGRAGVILDNFTSTRTADARGFGYGGAATFIRAGLQYTLKGKLDLGASVGWDDLSKIGGFAPAGYLSVRI